LQAKTGLISGSIIILTLRSMKHLKILQHLLLYFITITSLHKHIIPA